MLTVGLLPTTTKNIINININNNNNNNFNMNVARTCKFRSQVAWRQLDLHASREMQQQQLDDKLDF